MTPTAAIVELSALDLMKLVEGGEVRIGVVSIRPGEQSTCSIIGEANTPTPVGPSHGAYAAPGRSEAEIREDASRLAERNTARARHANARQESTGKPEITSLRFVRWANHCKLPTCGRPILRGTSAQWCPQTKRIYCATHDAAELLTFEQYEANA